MTVPANEFHFTPAELSARWRGRVKVSTLAKWRQKGGGPRYRKYGKAVLYPESAVVAFEVASDKGNTVE